MSFLPSQEAVVRPHLRTNLTGHQKRTQVPPLPLPTREQKYDKEVVNYNMRAPAQFPAQFLTNNHYQDRKQGIRCPETARPTLFKDNTPLPPPPKRRLHAVTDDALKKIWRPDTHLDTGANAMARAPALGFEGGSYHHNQKVHMPHRPINNDTGVAGFGRMGTGPAPPAWRGIRAPVRQSVYNPLQIPKKPAPPPTLTTPWCTSD